MICLLKITISLFKDSQYYRIHKNIRIKNLTFLSILYFMYLKYYFLNNSIGTFIYYTHLKLFSLLVFLLKYIYFKGGKKWNNMM